MKKLFYVMGLVLLFAACSDDYTDWADPQGYGAEEGSSVTLTIANASPIDYATLTSDSVQLFVPTVSSTDENAVTTYKVVLWNEDHTQSVTIYANANGYVSAEDLKNAMETLYGKRPDQHSVAIDVTGYTTVNGVTVANTGTATGTVTLEAPFIDTGYWLTGDFAGWNKDGALQFSHSDQDVYDDPVFSIVFTTTADNQYWKIISQTNYDGDFWANGETGVVGVTTDGDTSMSGNLTTNNPGAGKIEKAGTYLMTINMMDYTYTITAMAPQFYIFGSITGWDGTNALKGLMYPQSSSVFTYTTQFYGSDTYIKMWQKADFDNWEKCYNTETNGTTATSGTIVQSNGGAISAPGTGLYKFTFNLGSMTYSWEKLSNQSPTEYSSMGVIGDFNGWGSDVSMTQVTPHNWYVQTTVTDGGLKFRANGGWDVNWGADLTISATDFYGTGVANGSNITVPAGTYDFYLNDITGEFAIVSAN